MPDLSERVVAALRAQKKTITTVESCTGGLVAAAITDVPGASAVFNQGFITYSNEAKQSAVSVPEKLLAEYGAVSAPVAEAMASGALAKTGADIAVSCTGIAGPDGGNALKPVGLVFIGVAAAGRPPASFQYNFSGNRSEIRAQTVAAALTRALEILPP